MKQPIYYMQTDARWGSIPYTIDNDPQENIGYSGCGPTCAAMVLATFTDANIIPPDICTLSIQNGYRTANDGTAWGLFPWLAKKYGLQFSQTSSTSAAAEALKNGALVICSMGRRSAQERGTFTSSGHFILAYDYKDDMFFVNDPISSARTGKGYSKDIFIVECRQYFIFYGEIKEKGVVLEMDKWAVITTNVDVRVEPTPESDHLGDLVVGDKVKVIGKVYGKTWLMISLGSDKVGFIWEPCAKSSLAELDSIATLKEVGVIGDDGYWRENATEGKKCEGAYVNIILEKTANIIKGM